MIAWVRALVARVRQYLRRRRYRKLAKRCARRSAEQAQQLAEAISRLGVSAEEAARNLRRFGEVLNN